MFTIIMKKSGGFIWQYLGMSVYPVPIRMKIGRS